MTRLVALALAGTACGASPCPNVVVGPIAARGGGVTYVIGQSHGELALAGFGLYDPLTPMSCRGGVAAVSVAEPAGDAGPAAPLRWNLGVDCELDAGQGLSIALLPADDPRLLVAGAQPITTQVNLGYGAIGAGCGATIMAQPVTRTVSDARGEAAPWPDLVTPDFHRTIRYDLVLAPLRGKTSAGATCAEIVALTGWVEFELAATDVHPHLDATCPRI